MSYDGLLVKHVVSELASVLPGSKIDKITQPERDQVVFNLRAQSGRFKLLIDVSSHGSRTSLTNLEFENPTEAPSFCMLLRKHLQGARIENVYQIDNERIIVFELETINELGYSVNKKLIAENLGRYSNLVLVDAVSNKIIDCLKRVYTDERVFMPGNTYEKPVQKNEENALGYGPSTKVAIELGSDINSFNPCVWVDGNEKPKDVHVINMPQYEGTYDKRFFESIAEALDFYFYNRIESNPLKQKTASFQKQVKGIIDKYTLKLSRLENEILKSDSAEDYRVKGELINANIASIKPGSKKVKLTSYYDGSEVEIDLDEKLSPAKNGQAYFKKYSKLKSSKKEKLIQKKECEDNIEYLQTVYDALSLSDSYANLDAIREELYDQGFIRINKKAERKKKTKLQPMKIRISSGKYVLVGSSNVENDFVTFKLAKKGDIWFHTKDIHGAHVILCLEGEEATESDYIEAAEIAAFYSKARFSENVPVDYVPIKYVKKPASARPGMVIFTNNRTVWVNPICDPKDI